MDTGKKNALLELTPATIAIGVASARVEATCSPLPPSASATSRSSGGGLFRKVEPQASDSSLPGLTPIGETSSTVADATKDREEVDGTGSMVSGSGSGDVGTVDKKATSSAVVVDEDGSTGGSLLAQAMKGESEEDKDTWNRLRATVHRKRRCAGPEYSGVKGALLQAFATEPTKRTSAQLATIKSWISKKHQKFLELIGTSTSKGIMTELCQNVKLRICPPDTVIVKQNEQGNSCFILISGTCDVYRLHDVNSPLLREHTMFMRKPSEAHIRSQTGNQLSSVIMQVNNIYKAEKQNRAAAIEKEELLESARMAEEFGEEDPERGRAVPEEADPRAKGTSKGPKKGASRVPHKKQSELRNTDGLDVVPGVGLVSKITGESLEAVMRGELKRVQDRRILGENVVTIQEGDYFGELALLRGDAKRSATVVANGRYVMPTGPLAMMSKIVEEPDETMLLEIPRDIFNVCMNLQQSSSVVSMTRRLKHMQRVHCFRKMIETDQISLCYSMSTVTAKARQLVCRGGQQASLVYLVHKGRVVLRRASSISSAASTRQQVRDQPADLEVITSLGLFGDYEVISGADVYLWDAIALTDCVLLAVPREVFELAVHPKVHDSVVAAMARDIRHQAELRKEWWTQRTLMQHPLRLAVGMQTGIVPCSRCGSLKHITASIECPKQNEGEPLYTASGHLNTARRRESTGPKGLNGMQLDASTARKHEEEEARLKAEREDAKRREEEYRRLTEVTADLSHYPFLTKALDRCRDVWVKTDSIHERDYQDTLRMFGKPLKGEELEMLRRSQGAKVTAPGAPPGLPEDKTNAERGARHGCVALSGAESASVSPRPSSALVDSNPSATPGLAFHTPIRPSRTSRLSAECTEDSNHVIGPDDLMPSGEEFPSIGRIGRRLDSLLGSVKIKCKPGHKPCVILCEDGRASLTPAFLASTTAFESRTNSQVLEARLERLDNMQSAKAATTRPRRPRASHRHSIGCTIPGREERGRLSASVGGDPHPRRRSSPDRMQLHVDRKNAGAAATKESNPVAAAPSRLMPELPRASMPPKSRGNAASSGISSGSRSTPVTHFSGVKENEVLPASSASITGPISSPATASKPSSSSSYSSPSSSSSSAFGVGPRAAVSGRYKSRPGRHLVPPASSSLAGHGARSSGLGGPEQGTGQKIGRVMPTGRTKLPVAGLCPTPVRPTSQPRRVRVPLKPESLSSPRLNK